MSHADRNHQQFFNAAKPAEYSKFASVLVEDPRCGRSFEQDITRVRFMLYTTDNPPVRKMLIVQFENRRPIKTSLARIFDIAYWFMSAAVDYSRVFGINGTIDQPGSRNMEILFPYLYEIWSSETNRQPTTIEEIP
jgi:hypothetical protein